MRKKNSTKKAVKKTIISKVLKKKKFSEDTSSEYLSIIDELESEGFVKKGKGQNYYTDEQLVTLEYIDEGIDVRQYILLPRSKKKLISISIQKPLGKDFKLYQKNIS